MAFANSRAIHEPCGREMAHTKDGRPYAHRCTPAVSDPAPTVDETTTQGDDVNEIPEPHDAAKAAAQAPDKGPWFGAMYDGRCSVNECQIEEGDRIRADGKGGYECEDCGSFDDTMDRHVRASLEVQDPADEWQRKAKVSARGAVGAERDVDWQALASAAARRHTAAGFLGEANEGLRPEYRVTAEQFLDPAPASRGVANLENTAQYVDQYSRPASAITAEQFLDPAATEDVQPVMSVSGQPKKVLRDHMDRYAVVLPGETELEVYKSSGKPKGRTRVTTFIKAASSTIKLGEWKARNVVIGAARRRDLLLKAQGLTHEDDRDRLDAIARELEAAAGAKVGSDLGTYLHEFTEFMDAGLKTWRDAPEEFQRSLALYAQALADAGLEPIRSLIERTTIIREFGWVCGTFDRIFYHRPSGQYIIGDLKTAKTMDYGRNEIEAQLWAYAHGVNQNGIYDWNTRTWDRPYSAEDHADVEIKVSESVGVVIHMPVQGKLEGTVELLWADLEAGARHAELCQDVRSQPSGKMRPWGDGPAPLAPAREPLHHPVARELMYDVGGGLGVRYSITPVPVMEPWSWEDRFAEVELPEQASELWQQARAEGVDRMELQRLVGIAQTKLRSLGVRG